MEKILTLIPALWGVSDQKPRKRVGLKKSTCDARYFACVKRVAVEAGGKLCAADAARTGGGEIMLKDMRNRAIKGVLFFFCFAVVFCGAGLASAGENEKGRETPAMGNPPQGEEAEDNSVELLPVDPGAKPLIPGRTYSLEELSKNAVAEEREFFTDAYFVLCAPAPCPPCPQGVVCAACEEAVLYFADEPLEGKTEKELKKMREVLVGHHYEFCPELTKFKAGKKYHLKVAVQNMSPEEGLIYNEMRIVPEPA